MREFEQLRETFDATSVRPISDFIDAGDRVVVRLAYHAEGHGPEMNFEMTQVITVRNGKVVEARGYMNRAEAFEAVGLSEQDAHADS